MTETNREVIRRICRSAAERAGFTVSANPVYLREITQTQDLTVFSTEGEADPPADYLITRDNVVTSLNVLAEVNDTRPNREPLPPGVPSQMKTITIKFEGQPRDSYCYRLSVRTSAEAPRVKLDPDDIGEPPAIKMQVQVGDDQPNDAMVGFVSTDAEVKVDVPEGVNVTVILTINGTETTNMLSAILSVVTEVSIVYRLASEDQYQTIGSYAAGSAYDVDIRSRVYENVEKVDAELRSLVISNPRGGEVRAGFDFAEDSSEREAVFRRQRQVVIYPP